MQWCPPLNLHVQHTNTHAEHTHTQTHTTRCTDSATLPCPCPTYLRPSSTPPRTGRAWGALRSQSWRLGLDGVAAKPNWGATMRMMCSKVCACMCFCVCVCALVYRIWCSIRTGACNIWELYCVIHVMSKPALFATMMPGAGASGLQPVLQLTPSGSLEESSGDYDDEESLPNKLIVMTSKVRKALSIRLDTFKVCSKRQSRCGRDSLAVQGNDAACTLWCSDPACHFDILCNRTCY